MSQAGSTLLVTGGAGYIAILAGVVNFLPHPNPPRTRSLGSKKFTNDLGSLYYVMSERLTIISRPGGFLRLSIIGRYFW